MLYDFKCSHCGKTKEVSMNWKEYELYVQDIKERCSCGGIFKRVFNPPFVMGDTVVKIQEIKHE